MYRHGAGDLMDVVAGKPYGFSLPPLDRRVDESILNYSRIIALREVMAKAWRWQEAALGQQLWLEYAARWLAGRGRSIWWRGEC